VTFNPAMVRFKQGGQVAQSTGLEEGCQR